MPRRYHSELGLLEELPRPDEYRSMVRCKASLHRRSFRCIGLRDGIDPAHTVLSVRSRTSGCSDIRIGKSFFAHGAESTRTCRLLGSGSPHARSLDGKMSAQSALICRTVLQAGSVVGPVRHRYHGSAHVFASAARPGHVIVSIFHSNSLNMQVIRTVRRPLLQNQTKKRNPPPIAPSTFSPRSSFLFSRTSITRSNAAIRMARKRVPQFTEKATMYRGPPEYM